MRNYGHIKQRNMFLQVFLAIITLGLYCIYWYYISLRDMHIANGNTESRTFWWTVLLLVPVANLFALWHFAKEYWEFCGERYPVVAIFILELLLDPVVWFLVQRDLNRAAGVQYMGYSV